MKKYLMKTLLSINYYSSFNLIHLMSRITISIPVLNILFRISLPLLSIHSLSLLTKILDCLILTTFITISCYKLFMADNRSNKRITAMVLTVVCALLILPFTYDAICSLLISIQCLQIHFLSQENQLESESKFEGVLKKTDFSLLELLQYNCFLCKQDGNSQFSLAYHNKKGSELLEALNLNFRSFCARLIEVEKPHRTLESLINEAFSVDTACGLIDRIYLTLGDPAPHFSSFNNFKVRIVKINSQSLMLVATEQKVLNSLLSSNSKASAILCTLSHELRTLLNSVVGNLELLKDGIDSQERFQSDYEMAVGSSHLLMNELNDIFDCLQMNRRDFKLHCEEIEVEEVVREVRLGCQWLAKQKSIQFKIVKEGTLPATVFCDRSRIVQVIQSIVSKSIQLTESPGSVDLIIKAKPTPEIIFKVKSYGSTMKEKLQANIASKSSLTVTENLEILDLQICQAVCREMGTRLVVKLKAENYAELRVKIGIDNPNHANPENRRCKSEFDSSKMCGVPCSEDTSPEREIPLENLNVKMVHLPLFKVRNNPMIKKRESCNMHNLELNLVPDLKIKGNASCGDIEKVKLNGLRRLPRKSSALIVDDNKLNRYVLSSLLKKHNMAVEEAANGREAVNLVKQYINEGRLKDFKVIFMDLQMPVMNGAEAVLEIGRLCKEASAKAPAMVGLTADTLESDREHFLNAGLAECLNKPVTEEKIVRALKKYCLKN
eukprot:TRINITY_DN15995_c0_g1_i2.p1 TRINITY_DN15995_c0_g1~~TRINITY_DN15995_c0_g1_i2.p1  ORF type:complete len:722 (-),score=126.69 TRINITY_DN15995_c0_g1_i2:139-2304(-)